MYEITESVLTSKAPAYIGAGIHEVELTDVVLGVSKNGKTFFAYYYTNKKGQRLSKTEWEVNLPDDFETKTEDQKTRYEKAIQQQVERILKVAKLFIPKEDLKGGTYEKTFSGFCNFVKEKLGDTYKGISLRVKATYDKNGWVTTPSYTYEGAEWIELVKDVAKENSRIEIIPNRDHMTRPTTPKREERKASPLLDASNANSAATLSNANTNNELPF